NSAAEKKTTENNVGANRENVTNENLESDSRLDLKSLETLSSNVANNTNDMTSSNSSNSAASTMSTAKTGLTLQKSIPSIIGTTSSTTAHACKETLDDVNKSATVNSQTGTSSKSLTNASDV